MADIKNRKCYLYWIHLPEHTDMFSDGYVGITSLSVEQRWKLHSSKNTKKNNCVVLRRAIDKYREKLIVQTILVADREYCEDIENKLRPSRNIGWNIAAGGRSPAIGMKRSPEAIKKTADAKRGVKMSEEVVEANRLRGIAQMTFDNPWEHPYCNKKAWSQADTAFAIYKNDKYFGRRTLSKKLEVGVDSVILLIKKIRDGWNPNNGSAWKAFKENYLKENNGT